MTDPPVRCNKAFDRGDFLYTEKRHFQIAIIIVETKPLVYNI